MDWPKRPHNMHGLAEETTQYAWIGQRGQAREGGGAAGGGERTPRARVKRKQVSIMT